MTPKFSIRPPSPPARTRNTASSAARTRYLSPQTPSTICINLPRISPSRPPRRDCPVRWHEDGSKRNNDNSVPRGYREREEQSGGDRMRCGLGRWRAGVGGVGKGVGGPVSTFSVLNLLLNPCYSLRIPFKVSEKSKAWSPSSTGVCALKSLSEFVQSRGVLLYVTHHNRTWSCG